VQLEEDAMKTPVVLILTALALSACTRSDQRQTDTAEPPAPETPAPETPAPTTGDTVHVTGVIVTKDDRVPADGGVTLVIQPDTGDSLTIEFESMFTLPAPTAERSALYQKTTPLVAGDRVHVVATRKDGGLRLEDIEKVE
jgi:hypothetical protein